MLMYMHYVVEGAVVVSRGLIAVVVVVVVLVVVLVVVAVVAEVVQYWGWWKYSQDRGHPKSECLWDTNHAPIAPAV